MSIYSEKCCCRIVLMSCEYAPYQSFWPIWTCRWCSSEKENTTYIFFRFLKLSFFLSHLKKYFLVLDSVLRSVQYWAPCHQDCKESDSAVHCFHFLEFVVSSSLVVSGASFAIPHCSCKKTSLCWQSNGCHSRQSFGLDELFRKIFEEIAVFAFSNTAESAKCRARFQPPCWSNSNVLPCSSSVQFCQAVLPQTRTPENFNFCSFDGKGEG